MASQIASRIGRPPEPVPDKLATSLLDHISCGGSLIRWCRENGVSPSAVGKWRGKDEGFGEAYRRARMLAVEVLESEAIEIADRLDDPTRERIARLQCDVRRWAASRWQHAADTAKQATHGAVVVVTTGVPRTEERIGIDIETQSQLETDPGGGRPSAAALAAGGEEQHISPTHTSIPSIQDPPSP